MRVLKFGGSSVGNPERIRKVIKIVNKVKAKGEKVVVVVSAFQGVTDDLIEISNLAKSGNVEYKKELEKLKKRHFDAANELTQKGIFYEVNAILLTYFSELEGALQGILLTKEITPKILDYVLSFGERLCAYLISTVDQQFEFVDSRKLVITNDNFNNAEVNTAQTYRKIQEYFKSTRKIPVVTGFIGSTQEGETTTLGRGGSDLTGSTFAAALDATELEIWTDANGVMTADPRKVPKAFSLKELSYEEAQELSHFGAKVIYPPTIHPVIEKNIPILIKNTFDLKFRGTKIKGSRSKKPPIKGLASLVGMDILKVQCNVVSEAHKIAPRLFSCLTSVGIVPVLTLQGSYNQAVSVVVNKNDAAKAVSSLEVEFEEEIWSQKISRIQLEKGVAIIAAIGDGVNNGYHILNLIFSALDRNEIDSKSIVKNPFGKSISIVVKEKDENRVLQILHAAVFK